jgi:hypothetical protein
MYVFFQIYCFWKISDIFQLTDNIKMLRDRFVNSGTLTVEFKEPNVDLYIRKVGEFPYDFYLFLNTIF